LLGVVVAVVLSCLSCLLLSGLRRLDGLIPSGLGCLRLSVSRLGCLGLGRLGCLRLYAMVRLCCFGLNLRRGRDRCLVGPLAGCVNKGGYREQYRHGCCGERKMFCFHYICTIILFVGVFNVYGNTSSSTIYIMGRVNSKML